MSRRFRICMAKGGRESARPSYGRPKLTLTSREKKITFGGVPKTWQAAILTLERNPPERKFLYMLKISLRRISLYDQNCGLIIFRSTALFLLATHVLPASPNFRQAKHGQNGPAATVCQQGICCPICEHHFTHWTHPDISLSFQAGGRRVKKFSFSRICVAACDFFLPACCGLNFDATDLPNS